MTRYCCCLYHADYPMKFCEAHKYMSFRKYKVLQEENGPIDEEVTQAKLHEGFINTTIMRLLHEVHGLSPHTAQKPSWKKKEERSLQKLLLMNILLKQLTVPLIRK